MIEIEETNKHYKFAKYWELIGRPELEVSHNHGKTWSKCVPDPQWFVDSTYRIKGDRHWELRREWVDSGFTLHIEAFCIGIGWYLIDSSVKFMKWHQDVDYRKSEPKQEQPMTETKQLPTIIKGKKLELVDVPISTLPECLTALVNGYVLEQMDGFVWVHDNKFCYFDNIEANTVSDIDFYFEKFKAAYQLVDLPWWENIPEGGVLCEVLVGQSVGVPDGMIVLEVVLGVSHDGYAIFQSNIYSDKSNIEISRCKPVTDEWLESMKRGF